MNQQLVNPQFQKKALVVAMAAVFAASPAGAQEASSGIEEIIVTATRRAENIQNVGMSITALDAVALERANITDVSRLQFGVADLIYSDAGKDAKMALRGANSSNTFEDNPSVIGMYVDGVYKPNASMQTRAFFDVERLEFLKGPQGTYYGRNTLAGAINLYTNKPNFDGFSGSVGVSFERFSTLRTDGMLNIPVSDTFALRVAGFTENGDGYISNTAGHDLGAPNDYGIRLSALWTPTEDLEIITRISHIQEKGYSAGIFGWRQICRPVNVDGFTDSPGTVEDCDNPERGTVGGGPCPSADYWEVANDYTKEGDTSEENVTVEINWDTGPVTIKSITSYTDMQNELYFDFDYSSNAVSPGGNNDYTESWSQEFVFVSDYESALQWTAGVYYSEDDYENYFWIYNATVADNDVRPTVDVDGVEYTLFDGTPLVSTDIDINGAFGDSNWIEAETTAAFFQGEFSVSDNLRLIAGVRYSEEDKEAHGGGSNFTADGPVTFIATETNGTYPTTRKVSFAYDENAAGANSVDQDYDNTSWKASMQYDLNEDMMVYVTAATGFLSGALNNNGTFTDEQESLMYEIGYKSILMDGTLLFNLAYHDTEYTNLLAQLQTIDPNTGNVLTSTRNGGVINASGVELELQWVPTDEWSLGFTAAWLDATFGEFGQTSPYQYNRGVPTVPENMEGNTPGWSPDLMMNLFAEYTWDLGSSGALTPGLFFAYSDAYNTSNLYSLDPNHDQDSYTKTDLRLTWSSESGKYWVAAYVENIEDEAVLSRGNNGSQDNVQTGYLYPQNVGIKFQVNW